MHLDRALAVASALAAEFRPAVDRLEIAGSIRRLKPDVKDIELVAVARYHDEPIAGAQVALGEAPPTRRVNDLRAVVEGLEAEGRLQVIKPGTLDLVPWHLDDAGKYWRLYLPRVDLKVDLFLTTPASWGLVYMIRTGSAEFSQAMLARWKELTGGHSRDALLWRPGARTPEATPEESDVFDLCRVRFVPPQLRTSRDRVYEFARRA